MGYSPPLRLGTGIQGTDPSETDCENPSRSRCGTFLCLFFIGIPLTCIRNND
jgi:hypothetical protein